MPLPTSKSAHLPRVQTRLPSSRVADSGRNFHIVYEPRWLCSFLALVWGWEENVLLSSLPSLHQNWWWLKPVSYGEDGAGAKMGECMIGKAWATWYDETIIWSSTARGSVIRKQRRYRVHKERLTSPCLAAAARHFSVHCSISRNKLWNCCGSSDKFSAFALSTNEDGKIVSSQSKMIIALSLLLLLLVDMVTTKCNFERYSIYEHDQTVIKHNSQLSKFLGGSCWWQKISIGTSSGNFLNYRSCSCQRSRSYVEIKCFFVSKIVWPTVFLIIIWTDQIAIVERLFSRPNIRMNVQERKAPEDSHLLMSSPFSKEDLFKKDVEFIST